MNEVAEQASMERGGMRCGGTHSAREGRSSEGLLSIRCALYSQRCEAKHVEGASAASGVRFAQTALGSVTGR